MAGKPKYFQYILRIDIGTTSFLYVKVCFSSIILANIICIFCWSMLHSAASLPATKRKNTVQYNLHITAIIAAEYGYHLHATYWCSLENSYQNGCHALQNPWKHQLFTFNKSILSVYSIQVFIISSPLQIYRDISDIIKCWQIDKYRTPPYSDRTSIPRFGRKQSLWDDAIRNIDYTGEANETRHGMTSRIFISISGIYSTDYKVRMHMCNWNYAVENISVWEDKII